MNSPFAGASPSVFLAAARTREELDADYAPSRFVDSLPAIIQAWQTRTAAVAQTLGARFSADLAYGEHPRERIDFYRAETSAPAPLLVFIHGGFWQAVSKAQSGFIAEQWSRAGVHVAVMDYALAPEVSLQTITAQIRAGLTWLLGQGQAFGIDPDRVVVSGHSAGGHLAAMSQIASEGYAPATVRGLVLVSGVFELLPVCRSYVNDKLGLAEEHAAALSPARFQPARPVQLAVAVGEREPVAFQEQSRLQASQWQQPGEPSPFMLIARRNHFDLLDDLGDPTSTLGRATAALLDLS